MEKKLILPIALLVSLGGCSKDKHKHYTHTMDNHAYNRETVVAAESPDMETPELISFFDEEIKDFSFEACEVDHVNSEALADASDNDAQITWIEKASEQSNISKIYFGFNKYGVTSDQRKIVDSDIQIIREMVANMDSDSIIVMTGHADHAAGHPSYNMSLSEKRAQYVKDLFVTAGIPAHKITIVGRGQEVPEIVDGKPVEGDKDQQWLNRRVEIAIADSSDLKTTRHA